MTSLGQQVVLKEGPVFIFSHDNGDITGNTGLGLYYEDTRYLSLFTFQISGQTPPLLNFSGYRNFMATFQYANDIMRLHSPEAPGTPEDRPEVLLLPQTLSVRRSRFISDGLHERIELANYNRFPVPISLTLILGADFRDIFDVRGFPRDQWGQLLAPTMEDARLRLRYKGLDGLDRSTEITFELPPDAVDVSMPKSATPEVEPGIMVPVVGAPSYHINIEMPVVTLTWNLTLEPGGTPTALSFHVIPLSDHGPADPVLPAEQEDSNPKSENGVSSGPPKFDRAVQQMRDSYSRWYTESTQFTTDNEDFNVLLKRSKYDLRVLVEEIQTPASRNPEPKVGEPTHAANFPRESKIQNPKSKIESAYFPSAGIPWYVCPFGRDSLITAMQTLSLNPQIAVGTLQVLARYQGTREDPWREEQPGKILHELRKGEMARLGMVPHSPYYGSVDSTPLFVLLFAEAMRWLDNDPLYEELLPNVLRAVDWIDKYGDVDGDGLIEYVGSTTSGGILNQVWKDSGDSTQFPDGTLAETPFAAAEVQAYVYAAKKKLGELLRRRGDAMNGDRLIAGAEALKRLFNSQFWMDDAGFFSQGLDRDKVRIPTITSNPGHCLWCGIADDDKAAKTVQRMMQPDMLSGWGIRTIGAQSPSYNPMSYHNGSVWPHDNSLVIAGFKRYGFGTEANQVITQLYEAAQHFRYMRLPELYCGFTRDTEDHTGPTEYPVSCNPQAWAAAAPILMLQTMLGMEPDASHGRLVLNPRFPDWLNRVKIENLRVGNKRVDFEVIKQGDRYEVLLTRGNVVIDLKINR